MSNRLSLLLVALLATGCANEITASAQQRKPATTFNAKSGSGPSSNAEQKLSAQTRAALKANGRGNGIAELNAALRETAFKQSNVQLAPSLTRVYIWFYTTNDDKDWNSTIEVFIDNYSYKVAHGLVGYGTEYRDWSNFNGPCIVPVAGYYNPGHLNNGQIWIRLHPVGNDTWRFSIRRIEFHFSDGTMRAYWDWSKIGVVSERRNWEHFTWR